MNLVLDPDDDEPPREFDNWTEDVPEVEMPERHVWHLYGPNGEVLRTFSDRPPTGFHQGMRDKY